MKSVWSYNAQLLQDAANLMRTEENISADHVELLAQAEESGLLIKLAKSMEKVMVEDQGKLRINDHMNNGD